MELLISLGLNQTVVIQLAIFLVTFFFLKSVVFTPYSNALIERLDRTKGGEELAFDLQKETENLKADYEVKARQINDEISKTFETHRSAANKDVEKIIGAARADAQQLVETNRAQIARELASSKDVMKSEVPKLASFMVSKLLGRNN